MSLRRAAVAAFCLIVAAIAGAGAHLAGMPLAFVLAPMLVTAAFAMAGLEPWAPLAGRRAGQIVIGAAVGLNLTWPVLSAAAAWIPLMIAAAFVSVLVAAVFGLVFERLAKVDGRTAYFAMLPGGLAEMASVASSLGARAEPVALAQSLRVALVVLLLPLLIQWLGVDGGIESPLGEQVVPPWAIPVVLGAGLAGVLAVRRLGLNSPWMIGSLVAATVLASTGTVDGRLPDPLFWAGQYLLGIAVGARFRRDIVLRLVRVTMAAAGLVVAMSAVFGVLGILLAAATAIDASTGILVLAPGGLAEMAVTAKTLHLDITLVVLFHVIRVFLVNAFATHTYAALDRTGFFAAGSRLLSRILP